MNIPPPPPFRAPANRSRITHEPDELGKWTPLFPDMLGHRQYGGGSVPEPYHWPSNPKEWQEELSNVELRREAEANAALGPGGELPTLGSGPVHPFLLPPGEPAKP
ncbi:MAG TPA: hypothetical protein VK454_09955 [Myxococcaceae bacterium]|nr:hypothetical protein [Myxococcaceae bacterium]